MSAIIAFPVAFSALYGMFWFYINVLMEDGFLHETVVSWVAPIIVFPAYMLSDTILGEPLEAIGVLISAIIGAALVVIGILISAIVPIIILVIAVICLFRLFFFLLGIDPDAPPCNNTN